MRHSPEEIRTILKELKKRRARDLESETLEFKEWIADRERLYKTLIEYAVCFANHKGGTLVLGVKDKVIGPEKALMGCGAYDAYEMKTRIYEATDPKILVEIEELPVEEFGVKLLLVHIPQGVYLHTTTDGTAKVRVGSDCRPMTGSMRLQRLVERGQLDFTAEVVKGLSAKDFDPEALELLRKTMQAVKPESSLLKLRETQMLDQMKLTSDGVPTRAGLLLVGKQEQIEAHIPTHEIQYIRMKNDIDYEFREELRTNLLKSLERLYSLIEDTNRVTSLRFGLIQQDIRDYPVESYREAILNAVQHRDYTAPGAVFVRQYPDRLEISNPGGFLEGITLDNLLWQDSRPRNRLLTEILKKIGYVEQAGVGIKRIFYYQITSGKLPPVYSLDPGYVRVTLRDGSLDEPFLKLIHHYQKQGVELSLEALIVLSALRRQSEFSLQESAKILQRDIDRTRGLLYEMVGKGILEKYGQKRALVFRLSAEACRQLGETAPYVRAKGVEASRQLQMVLEYIHQYGSIDNRTVRELLGLDQYKASRLLTQLVNSGKLRRTGNARATRYLLPD